MYSFAHYTCVLKRILCLSEIVLHLIHMNSAVVFHLGNLGEKQLIGPVCSLWLVKVIFQLTCMTQIELLSTQKNLHVFGSPLFCRKQLFGITGQICVLLFTFLFVPPPPRSPRESPEEMKMSAEWWRCWAAPLQHEGIAVFCLGFTTAMAFCPFPAVPGGSSQGSVDWVLGESARTSAGLTWLCTFPLGERMSTSHGFAYQHSQLLC